LIYNYEINAQFPDVDIHVPPCVVLGTDVFDEFLQENELRDYALNASDDNEIAERFLLAKNFPPAIIRNLADFVKLVQTPLAVRSSSLLEDSQYYPFAGVYRTYMIPNNSPDRKVRLQELICTIKRVYASMFFQKAKNYFEVTSYRLEEEKMAVVIQTMVGGRHGNRFYPDFSGAAKSYNYYPVAPQKSTDGLVSVALGLGKMVFDGGMTVRFAPKYPQIIPQFNTVEESLRNNQQSFYALNLDSKGEPLRGIDDRHVEKYDLRHAEKDGPLRYSGSTYVYDNHAIYDGLARDGGRMVTFAPILKHKLFPLPEIADIMLDICSRATGTPVEIEFAANLSVPQGEKREFALLQMRPLAIRHEFDALDLNEIDVERLLCKSNHVLGNGMHNNIYDIVVVDITRFDRLRTGEVAEQISQFNQMLVAENRPYLLIGVGRWGTLDPMLGIPVSWEQISGASTIVEAGFEDMIVEPSQGSHFFHNIVSFRVGYFTIGKEPADNAIDWGWLTTTEAYKATHFIRHLRFENPAVVKMNGHYNKGVITKPG